MKTYLIIAIFLFSVSTASAQIDYTPLAPIPQLTNPSGQTSTSTFLTNLVPLIISIAGGLAVIRIVIGGIQYMTTDAWSGKNEAKDTIRNAVIGLLLAASAYTILYTINPDLVKINLAIPRQGTGSVIDPSDLPGTTNKNSGELGCDNCDEIPRDEMSVSPGACEQQMCFAKNDIITTLKRIVNIRVTVAEGDERFARWQVIKAFPNSNSSLPCFKPGVDKNKAGYCVGVALPNPTQQNVAAFLKEFEAKKYRVEQRYIVPDQRRATLLRASNDLTDALRQKIVVVPNSVEHFLIGDPSLFGL